MTQQRSDAYRASGVDIDAGDELVRRIRPLAQRTAIPGARGGVGGFAGVFDLAAAGYGSGAPRLVAGTDGVGTKLKVAFAMGRHDTIGIDCVAMCVNDMLVTGARPLFFLDYLATGRLDVTVAEAVVQGVTEGCLQAGCWLMGGETAEMPSMYADNEYDIAGFVVGAVGAGDEIDGSAARPGDVVLGVASTGLHSNGYSLARRVLLAEGAERLAETPSWSPVTLGELLLAPTKIYRRATDAIFQAGLRPKALAHITGGGLWENPQRSLPSGLGIRFETDALRPLVQPVFAAISAEGGVSTAEMYRVFNMGVGLTLVCERSEAEATMLALQAAGEVSAVIGEVIDIQDNAPRIAFDRALGDAPMPAPHP